MEGAAPSVSGGSELRLAEKAAGFGGRGGDFELFAAGYSC